MSPFIANYFKDPSALKCILSILIGLQRKLQVEKLISLYFLWWIQFSGIVEHQCLMVNQEKRLTTNSKIQLQAFDHRHLYPLFVLQSSCAGNISGQSCLQWAWEQRQYRNLLTTNQQNRLTRLRVNTLTLETAV